MAITDWPVDERPREKLLNKGPSSLSDAELLAIFLRTGISGMSAVDLARHLLTRFNGLRPLLEASQEEFCEHLGLGPAKYAQLQAVLEMGQRHLQQTLAKPDAFTEPNHVRHFLTSRLRHLPHEVFACLFLDNQHRLITYEELFRGTIDGASVYPREVVKKVLSHNAAAVILAHNHPSGVTDPSPSDERITAKLQQALQLVDVRVLDHFIVGDNDVFSMAEHGLIN
ncbi:DNA repair protein RadC [Oceaniserpentilla sp. 4NH20-0058]|uniref:RadC family protein n=1 Tax=Oceaniserpentilla sp. 4NH20-0058 TaxID=3127660 RepID=UPI00310C0646